MIGERANPGRHGRAARAAAWSCLLGGVLLARAPEPGRAATPSPGGPQALRKPAAPWPRHPGADAPPRALAQVLAQLRTALSPTGRRVRNPLLLLRALDALARMARTAPRAPSVWYWLGWAARRADDETTAIQAWRHLLRIAPDHHTIPDVTFALGVLLAKAGRYRESIAVYQHGLPRTPRLSTRSIMASNGAESAMAVGDLRLAVALYRRSLALRPVGNRAAWWGLAVALDRMERTAAAERATREALRLDPHLQGLTGPAVFFVPPGDVHYYLGLAYSQAGHTQKALQQFRRFLRRQPRSRYAPRALSHVLQLEAELRRLRPAVVLQFVQPRSATEPAERARRVVARCYRRRARRLPAPEGILPLQIWLRSGRVTRVSRGYSVRTVTDAALLRCVRGALAARRIAPRNGPDRLLLNFVLQLVP